MKRHSKIHFGILAVALLFSIAIFMLTVLPNVIAPNVVGPNYKNVSIRTNLTITHSKPDVLNMTIFEALNTSALNITVTAGSTKKIYCNATVRSWEGFNDISRVNATLYHVNTSNQTAIDDNSSHYSNTSCILNSSLATGAPFTGWYVCSFDVLYYANNGSWRCNMTVSNSYTSVNPNFTGSGYGTTIFYPVFAINVTDGIDYGGVAVEDYSLPDRRVNVTNLGNMNMNISVEGYGAARGDGLAMICNLSGNITVDNERFSALNGTAFGAKTPLVGTIGGVNIPGLTMPKQTNSSMLVRNTTYWQLFIPPNPAGNCTGNVIFTATAP